MRKRVRIKEGSSLGSSCLHGVDSNLELSTPALREDWTGR